MSTAPAPTAPVSAAASGRVDAATAAAWAAEQDVVVVDVRSPGEHAGTRVTGSTNIPVDLLEAHPERTAAALAATGAPVLLVCRSGARSARALERLQAVGLDRVHALDGGVPAYAAAGGPVETGSTGTSGGGRPRWAMDRQVRLTAGSLVLASVLASLAAPRARFLAGAVGAGLTWSAVSDTCAMARALCALPYNRDPQAPGIDEALGRLPTGSRAAGGTGS
ncbi:rhodanese-like domain-containing protein [uncultured Pseudokineococcus sp.]|uniref:rhodanese-like domain-containing protein n=1 Tax=uncultured Pseudokineococcus sp. TaxID=1642928 RepID=UPI0026198A20|nr:rhodanese-like domain-containing protein [uncultured Pseudokineococcus sp.]